VTAAQIIEAILEDAVRRGAESAHLEPLSRGLRLSLRIAGVLHPKPNFQERMPRGIGPWLVRRLKELAALDVSESHRPQSGEFVAAVDGRDRTFRAAALPTVHGEKMVVRIVDRAAAPPALDALGFSAADLAAVRRALAGESGLVLLLGPCRDDRQTTLRAMMAASASPGRSVVAIRDAAWPDTAGVTQVAAPRQGRKSAAAETLSAGADLDADVILVEELGDRASALAAVEAAANCLVVAGMAGHGERPDPTILLAAGADPMALATTLVLCIVERSARRICPHCKTEVEPDPDLLRQLGADGEAGPFPSWLGKGCPQCSLTGHAGKVGLFSVLQADDALAARLLAETDGCLPADVLRGAKFTSLREAAMEKVREGIISLEEAARVLGSP
jgi:type IV pilus assembly protein PilB